MLLQRSCWARAICVPSTCWATAFSSVQTCVSPWPGSRRGISRRTDARAMTTYRRPRRDSRWPGRSAAIPSMDRRRPRAGRQTSSRSCPHPRHWWLRSYPSDRPSTHRPSPCFPPQAEPRWSATARSSARRCRCWCRSRAPEILGKSTALSWPAQWSRSCCCTASPSCTTRSNSRCCQP